MSDAKLDESEIQKIIANAFEEDLGNGDHSANSCIPEDAIGGADLIVKQDCILAGVDMAKRICNYFDADIEFIENIADGQAVKFGDIAFSLKGSSRSLLAVERLLLNSMQRMSAIATETSLYTSLVQAYNCHILDTRKTTPGIRCLEKWAVRIGGGLNHRMGLYDMIMLKDNHIDFCGGIQQAIEKCKSYLALNKLNLKIEVEARSLDEVQQILDTGSVDRIMLDNFNYSDTRTAVVMIGDSCETESSGGITKETVAEYAACGVNYISVGALTHGVKNVDLSLKAWRKS